jgi:hypothetical protein
MQIVGGRLLLSASDLVNFLGCRHATYLDRRDLAEAYALAGFSPHPANPTRLRNNRRVTDAPGKTARAQDAVARAHLR